MARWRNLTAYVGEKYKIAYDKPSTMGLYFNTGDGRSQMVVLSYKELADDNEEWVQIESPVAKMSEVNATKALELAEDLVCGGLAKSGDYLVFRHSVPLADMSVEEFESPFRLVIGSADGLEKELTAGGDQL